MSFQPAFCPCRSPECESTSGFQYQRRGTFQRVCDGRLVQRYQCKRCKRTFSTQTFRVDRGLRRPSLDRLIFLGLVSKVSQRQLTRKYHCGRGSVARRLERYGKHCRAFHQVALRQRGHSLPWEGQFQLDELETFETDRRLKPVTVPLLVHLPSRCVLHAAVGTLPPRKPLPPRKQKQLERIEAEEQKKRCSQSREKVFWTAMHSTSPSTLASAARRNQVSNCSGFMRERIARWSSSQSAAFVEPSGAAAGLSASWDVMGIARDKRGGAVVKDSTGTSRAAGVARESGARASKGGCRRPPAGRPSMRRPRDCQRESAQRSASSPQALRAHAV